MRNHIRFMTRYTHFLIALILTFPSLPTIDVSTNTILRDMQPTKRKS